MVNAGILDGDKLVVQKESTAKNGEIVGALVDDSATVKTFFKEENHIRLQPENDAMEPLSVDDVKILGKVISLFRPRVICYENRLALEVLQRGGSAAKVVYTYRTR